jgi:uncharacterized protein DUF5925/ATPase family protein associated with various cellular activities (AAA)
VLWRSGPAEVMVTAVTAELAETVIGRIVGDAEVTRAADDAAVTIGFWHRAERRGGSRSARAVRAEPWASNPRELRLGDGDGGGGGARWRLLLLEDCDELIAGDAKRASGQALSRLLNLTDGVLGQGRNVLVGITTNEDIRSLHPAVIRPGRCLAQIEVGPLPAGEAAAWLGRADGITSALTLANLYARRGAAEPIASASEATRVGLYL